MFSPFFYVLKSKGIEVSITEWLTLMDALDQGLCESSFTDFYYIARMILVKSEADYDKFDVAFAEYFKGIQFSEDELVLKKVRDWFETEDKSKRNNRNDELYKKQENKLEKEQIQEMFKERMAEQKMEHNGGNYWIGKNGTSTFGKNGRNPGGIRIGGKPGLNSAFQVIGERRYQDFRNDKALNMRQFQVAFRQLRQFSSRIEAPRTELDLEETVNSTCNHGGYLKLEFEKPRKNTVKLLLLFDSGGTMYPFSHLCNHLFQAVHKANHFKDVKTYYFHNCIYKNLYTDPECDYGKWVETDWVIKNLDKDYKVIIIGDAQMAPEELFSVSGNYRGPNGGLPGMEWLKLLKKRYKKIVWLNPRKHDNVERLEWLEAEYAIANLFPMYKLTVDGLKEAIQYLKVNR